MASIVVLLACLSACSSERPADLVLRGGAVYTVDANRSWANAVAVRDGHIIYVGDDEHAKMHIGPHTQVVELVGRMVLPGLHDSHIHPMSGAYSRLMQCRLHDLEWPGEVFAAVRKCAADLKDGEWLMGTGLDPAIFDEPGLNRTVLDELVPDRPANLTTEVAIPALVNSRALAAADIDVNTPDPPNGVIERDPSTGEPTGILRGGDAVYLVRKWFPIPTSARYREALRRGTAMANQYGITSLIDASVSAPMFDAYCEADIAGELTARVVASHFYDYRRDVGQIDEMVPRKDQKCGGRFRADAVKIFVDGGVQERTAALLEPYFDDPETTGRLRFTPELLNEIVARLDAEQFQVHMHVYGDRAIRMGLDAIERAIEANGPRERRHQLAHVMVWDQEDIPRLKQLGVTANFQPLLPFDQSGAIDRADDRLGPDRSRWVMPIATVVESGSTVVAGSDWPSPSMNPLLAMQMAITRRPPDGSEAAWLPEQRVDLAEMIGAYTIAGAWLAREEAINGSIEVGKAADLIVLEKNLFDVDLMALKDVRVLLTLLEGKPVYSDREFGNSGFGLSDTDD